MCRGLGASLKATPPPWILIFFGRESRGLWVKLGVPATFTWSQEHFDIYDILCHTIPGPCDIAANEVF